MHPYSNLPSNRYWRRSASRWRDGDYADLYRPRFPISRGMSVATAGSCFAQHIGRNFRERGYAYLDLEPAPHLLPREAHPSFGYGIFSCRYGNIYTSRQLLQLIRRAYDKAVPLADHVWEQEGKFFDAFRPSIEPEGFSSLEELMDLRASHLQAVRKMFRSADLFVFTLGLTELWMEAGGGAAYPTCPGTVAGTYDPAKHVFRNLTFGEVLEDMRSVIRWVVSRKPRIKILLTVSPVPLAATATQHHVVTATTYSKSVLRAVAGQLYDEFDCVDYFPSYEIITSTLTEGVHYGSDHRNVTEAGVASVMSCFFRAHGDEQAREQEAVQPALAAEDHRSMLEMNVVCDEARYDLSLAK